MRKKKLLFIIPSLQAGGGEKSLVNLLSQLDYSKYDVDLFLLHHEGVFMKLLPKHIKVLRLPEAYQNFALPLLKSLAKLLQTGNVLLSYYRILFTVRNRIYSHTSINEQFNWKYISKSLQSIDTRYDTAISFLEKTSTYFCVDKVNADQKIAWVHNDYDELGMDSSFDRPYFQQLDYIMTVSDQCAEVLKNRFPTLQHKIDVMYNVVSPTSIKHLALQGEADIFQRRKGEIILLSIGRLHPQKGYDVALQSCKRLIDRGFNIRWFVIGEGEQREQLSTLISEYQLEQHFILLGLRSNPYPYIKQADIYVQPSKFEGKSIALDEAKILHKPIVITNYSTAKDQIRHGYNGLIARFQAEDVANALEQLIGDDILRNQLSTNLSMHQWGTEEEIHKLYSLIGG